LRRAVASAVSQSDRVRVVIVDDGSTAEFAAVGDELAAMAQGGVQVVHQTSRGPGGARNAGLLLCTSPAVMFLDSDDELADGAFAAIEAGLLTQSDVGLLCGAVSMVMPDGEIRTASPAPFPGVPWTDLSWLSGSFAVRTEIARAVGGYDEALRFGENTDFILRIAEECRRRAVRVVTTNLKLSIYHQGPEDRRYDTGRLDAALHLLARGRFDLELPSERARLHGMVTVNAARLGRYRLAVSHAARAVVIEPRQPRHLARFALSLSGPLARRRWLRS